MLKGSKRDYNIVRVSSFTRKEIIAIRVIKRNLRVDRLEVLRLELKM